MALVSLDQLNEALADRLEELLPDLIGGRAVRGEWIALSTEEGGIGDSLSVNLRGAKRGKWYHHASGLGGDPIGLINYARFNNRDMKAAFQWALRFVGGKIEPETEKDRELRLSRMRSLERKQKREEQRRRGAARYIWHTLAKPDIRGTASWHYLNNRLAGQLGRLGHLPGCIRHMDELENHQLGVKLPAMVTAIVNLAGEQIALHRTWLIKRGAGADSWDRLREGDVDQFGPTADRKALNGKKTLGSYRGGAIRLWAGTRVHEQTGEVKRGVGWSKLGPGSSIMLVEGIETGLSLALAMPERRIATTISVDGFAHVELPPVFSQVTIAADRDPGNVRTADALQLAKETLAAQGRHVRVVYPAEGYDDWNTALKAIGRTA